MIYIKSITAAIPNVLRSIDLNEFGKKHNGKVRDFYVKDGKRILVTTDRQSAFDVVLGHIPYKGTVLNQLSAFWFEKTKHIVRNHMIEIPHRNVLIAYETTPIPVEIIVRGYMSGVTKTSIWYSYKNGERIIYGVKLPNGLKKNDKLPEPVITPTTHGGGKNGHDERLTKKEIIEKKLINKKLYKEIEKTALALFEFGSKWCEKKGLILVDTKYEFGLINGKLILIDEIHTPDSSRFWIKKTYKNRIKKGQEPENFDKEFLRLWYAQKGFTGSEKKIPSMTEDLVVAMSKRYIQVYEKITGKKFKSYTYPIEQEIKMALSKFR